MLLLCPLHSTESSLHLRCCTLEAISNCWRVSLSNQQSCCRATHVPSRRARGRRSALLRLASGSTQSIAFLRPRTSEVPPRKQRSSPAISAIKLRFWVDGFWADHVSHYLLYQKRECTLVPAQPGWAVFADRLQLRRSLSKS